CAMAGAARRISLHHLYFPPLPATPRRPRPPVPHSSRDGHLMTAEILLIFAGAFAGGFVNGLTGFGTGMTALVLWLHALPVTVAATLVLVCSVVAQLQSLPSIWHALAWRRLAPFLIGGLIGIPL